MVSIAKGKGKVWAVRLWESETINELGWTEAAWCRLSLAERARKVCALKVAEWLSALETEREMARMRARGEIKKAPEGAFRVIYLDMRPNNDN